MEKSENNKLVDRIIRVILIIIIIFLLIHNCALLKKNKEYQNKPGDNVDIIEINCNNDSCKNKEVESLEFTQNNISVKKGENIKLTVIVNPTELSNSKFTWTSSDESIVTVDSNGNIKGIKPGTAEITVTSSNGKKAVCTVNVVEETVDVQKILLTINKKNINVGSTTQIKAKIEPENATNRELIWTTSDKNIATVDSNGVVKGKKSGTVTITAKTKDGKVVASTKITINDVPKKIESLSFTQNNVSIKKGDTTKLIVTVKPTELSNSKLTWTSSDESIVSIDSNGNIKGIKPGKAQITVTSSNGKKAECTVNVIEEEIKLEEIILTPSKDKIEKDEMTQISVVFKPEKATNRELVWTTSDKNIATVDENGVVKGIKSGTVTITAKTKDGKVVASTKITINNKEIESLSFAQNNVSVKKGDTTKLIVTINPTELSNSALTWTSSDESIVSVDGNGNIKGIKPGTVKITVTSSNGKKAECTVNVIEEEIKVTEIILTPTEEEIYVGDSTQINAIVKPDNATNRELVWTTSDKNIATVDENGVVKGINEGTVTITAKTKDGKVDASTTITISEKEENKIFGVSDELNTPITWNGSSDLKIFEKTQYTMDGRIAPESSNTYEFKVKNGTGYNLKYNISFVESNPHNINMKYKLKKNDEYIIDHYVTASELNVPEMLLNSKINDTYYLEWKWISSDNDTEIGKTGNVNYNLKIIVEAESTNG